jgi:hypothetical protein
VTTLAWALTAAVLYGTGAALQQRQAAATPSQAAGRPRLLLLLARRPWWLLGIGVEVAGFAAHAVALRTGPLTVVQMMIASSLLFSVATVRLWSGRALSWTGWAAVLVVIGGIAAFVALASPAGANAGGHGASGHAELAAVCLAACAVPLAAAGLAAAGRRRTVLLAAAAGLADAGMAVVTMAFSHIVSGGLTGMAGSWPTYALVLGGPCSLLLTQTAYQAGRPMITLPVIAVVTPVASLAAGNLLLGESARLGVVTGAVVTLAVLATSGGLVVLARLTTGQPGPAGGPGSSVALPAFPASGSRSGRWRGPLAGPRTRRRTGQVSAAGPDPDPDRARLHRSIGLPRRIRPGDDVVIHLPCTAATGSRTASRDRPVCAQGADRSPDSGAAEQSGHESAMDDGQRGPDAAAQAPVIVQERRQRHPPFGRPDQEVAGQKPGSGLEPDPVRAASADLPSGHGGRRSSPAESQTQQSAPDQQLSDARNVAEHRTSPFLRCCLGVRAQGEQVGVVDHGQRAERTEGLGHVIRSRGALDTADGHFAVPD